jgi:hypothetical protein
VIRFKCACGKRVKVPTSAAGKRVRCPFCGKEQRVPERGAPRSDIPVAEVVAGPPGAPAEPPAAQGLAALAQAVKANGGAKETRRNPVASVRDRAKQQDLPTSAQLIARRTGAIADHRKYFLIGIGVAAGLMLAILVIALLTSGGGGPEPVPAGGTETPPAGDTAHRRGSAAGELFKNVPFEKPSDSAEAAPAASP